MDSLRIHAQTIIDDTLKQVQPHAAVQRALEGRTCPRKMHRHFHWQSRLDHGKSCF